MLLFLFNFNLFQTGNGCFLVKTEVSTQIHSLPSSMHKAYYCKCKAQVSALKLKASEQHSILAIKLKCFYLTALLGK